MKHTAKSVLKSISIIVGARFALWLDTVWAWHVPTFILLVSLLAVALHYHIFIYTPVYTYADLACKRMGYAEVQVTIGLKATCVKPKQHHITKES